MKAIPTTYKGTQFKSRMEADVAFVLDAMGMEWVYEPESFLLDDGTHYMPDFWIEQQRLWVEVRGYESEKGVRQIRQFSQFLLSERPQQAFVVIGSDVPFMLRRGFLSRTDLVRCGVCERWTFTDKVRDLDKDGTYWTIEVRCCSCGAWLLQRHGLDFTFFIQSNQSGLHFWVEDWRGTGELHGGNVQDFVTAVHYFDLKPLTPIEVAS
jgi:hypothetical protein